MVFLIHFIYYVIFLICTHVVGTTIVIRMIYRRFIFFSILSVGFFTLASRSALKITKFIIMLQLTIYQSQRHLTDICNAKIYCYLFTHFPLYIFNILTIIKKNKQNKQTI